MSLTCKVLVTQQLTWKQRIRLWWLSQVQSWRALVLGTCVTSYQAPDDTPAERHDAPEGPFFYISGRDKVH